MVSCEPHALLRALQDSYAQHQQAPYVPSKPAQPAAPPTVASFNPTPGPPPAAAYGAAANFSSAYSAPVPQQPQQPPTQQQQPAVFQPSAAPPPAQPPAASLYRCRVRAESRLLTLPSSLSWNSQAGNDATHASVCLPSTRTLCLAIFQVSN